MSDSFGSQDLFVSLEGNDSCLGNRPDVDKDGKNGPFKTIAAAKNAVRLRKKTGLLQGPLTVWLRGGRYELSEPLVFDSQDSAPVTYRSYPGETATISGGKRIESWKEDSVNGVACWVAQLPEVADGEWSFRQLFVNGKHVPWATAAGEQKDQFSGYCQPASFDITDAVRRGQNTVAIYCVRTFINELGTGGLLGAPVVIYREK